MKKLLVATDLSARSDRAVQRAFVLGRQHGAEVEIINVVDDTLPASIIERHEETARTAIDAQVRALPDHGDVKFSTRIVRGQDYLDIIRRAEETGTELILLGIHRHTTRPLFRGTTAERVIRLGQTPVLVVREPVTHPYLRVLIGVDLSPHSRFALSCAASLAPDAQFQLVHATHVPFKGMIDRDSVWAIARDEEKAFRRLIEPDLQELSRRLGKSTADWDLVVKEGLVRGVIADQIETFHPDLVVVGTHGRTGIANAMLGSVAEDLLADAPTDVLAVKAW